MAGLEKLRNSKTSKEPNNQSIHTNNQIELPSFLRETVYIKGVHCPTFDQYTYYENPGNPKSSQH